MLNYPDKKHARDKRSSLVCPQETLPEVRGTRTNRKDGCLEKKEEKDKKIGSNRENINVGGIQK
jgi:hypothetical protein